MTASTPYSAVLWDFGGVILSSPFEAFRRYESERGLPPDTIRSINARNPDSNAWARFERSEITASEFDDAFAEEARELGHGIRGYDVLELLRGEIRPTMVHALRTVKGAGFKTACLTNNVVDPGNVMDPGTVVDPGNVVDPGESQHGEAVATRSRAIADVMGLFDAVVESSKVGCRKPEVRFYEIACAALGVTPKECVFLDDLGINLKPAAALGMTTIKVLSADQAIGDLEQVLKLPLRT